MKPLRLRLRRRLNLEADAEGGGGMVFDTRTAAICACNASAWTAIAALQRGDDVEGLVKRITAEFDVDVARARQDVLALVKELRSLDMLETKE